MDISIKQCKGRGFIEGIPGHGLISHDEPERSRVY